MRIERIEDKKFMITLTEKEAIRITGTEDMDLEFAKIYSQHVGQVLLHYMIMCCEIPDMKQPVLDTEL